MKRVGQAGVEDDSTESNPDIFLYLLETMVVRKCGKTLKWKWWANWQGRWTWEQATNVRPVENSLPNVNGQWPLCPGWDPETCGWWLPMLQLQTWTLASWRRPAAAKRSDGHSAITEGGARVGVKVDHNSNGQVRWSSTCIADGLNSSNCSIDKANFNTDVVI